MTKQIIPLTRSIVPACDVSDLGKLGELVAATCDVEGIGAYKIGFSLGLKHGLNAVVDEIRKTTRKPVVYDHQKAATDIPDTGETFARACAEAGVDAVILFPMAGPATQVAWTKAAQEAGLGVIVGTEMTHERFLQSDGGYLVDDAPVRALAIAGRMGVNEFVVPGNKPERIRQYREEAEKLLGAGNFVFHSPGFVAQGGELSEGARAAGENFHAIVGRAIYAAGGGKEMRDAAVSLCDKLIKA